MRCGECQIWIRSDELLQRLYLGGDGGPSYAEALRQLAIAREKLASAQTADAEVKLAERKGELIHVDDAMRFMETFAIQVKSAIESWPIPEKERMPIYFSLQDSVLQTGKLLGIKTGEHEKELAAAKKTFEADLAAGKTPYHWADMFRPENEGRIWSVELGRYYTKAEIIAKFGPNTKISPIDKILAEAAEMDGDTAL